MAARYPNSVAPLHVLEKVNVYALNLGAPKLADTDWIVVDRAMANAAFTLAHTTSGDATPALARNVTVKATQQGGSDDTPGKVTVVGKNVRGATISEEIIPLNGSTVAGLLAFASITSVTQSGWTAGGTADRIEVGFGNLIGVPAALLTGNGSLAAAGQIFTAYLDTTAVAPVTVWDADEPEKNTIDCSAGTYNGTKKLTVLVRRS